MTKQDIIERAKRVSFSSNPKDYIEFVGELAKENDSVPADVEGAEIRKIRINHNDVRYVVDAIPGAAGVFRTEEDAKRGVAIFKAGMLAERERLMKEAVEVAVYYDFENRLAVTAQLPEDSPHKFCDKVSVIIIKKEK